MFYTAILYGVYVGQRSHEKRRLFLYCVHVRVAALAMPIKVQSSFQAYVLVMAELESETNFNVHSTLTVLCIYVYVWQLWPHLSKFEVYFKAYVLSLSQRQNLKNTAVKIAIL